MGFIKDMLSAESATSSARVINFIGAISGTCLLAYDTALHGLSIEAFGVYLAYCGGVYGVSKGLDKIQGKDNAA